MRWIVTDDIFGETWRRLLEFSNLELAYDEIARRHGSPTTKSEIDNYKKQALQARACVLQGKEYFEAARASSLFTRGNHAYYGAVALSSLIMLIRGDGSKSLDRLRQQKGNNHHGLEFSLGCNANAVTRNISLLEHSRVEILARGHFSNWYETLPNQGQISSIINIQKSTGPRFRTMNQVGGFSVSPFDSLVARKRSLLELFKYLPDLAEELSRFGVYVAHCRSDLEVTHQEGGSGPVTYYWRMHGCRNSDELESILAKFALPSGFSDAVTCELGVANGALVQVRQVWPGEVPFVWPDSRDAMNCDTITYSETIDTLEIVDLYLVAYQLSMLSRYFPDVWIRCIESQCRAARLVEKVVDVVVKKLPILALSLISPENVFISTHLPPWKA